MREQAVHVVRVTGAAEDAIPAALRILDATGRPPGWQSIMVLRGREDVSLFALYCDWDGPGQRQRCVESEAYRSAVELARERLGVVVERSASLREVLSHGVQPRQARVVTGALLVAREGKGGEVRDAALGFYRRSVGWPGCVALTFAADFTLETFFLVQEWERRQGLEYYLGHPERRAFLASLADLLVSSPTWFEQVSLWEYHAQAKPA